MITAPIQLDQTTSSELSNRREAEIDPAAPPNRQPDRVERLNDFQKINVRASPEETLLFLSQQFHRAWEARSHNSLHTVIVNGFYQGFILPPDTSEVELLFRPFALWSCLPQLLFAASGALLLLRSGLQMRARQSSIGSRSAGDSQPI